MQKVFDQVQETNSTTLVSEVLSVIEGAILKCPKYNTKENYLLEMRKANILNQTLRSQIILLQTQVKVSINEVIINKKSRRRSGDIQKKFKCCAVSCGKAYGTEGSLHLHQRIKQHFSECDTVSVNTALIVAAC